MFVVDTKFLDQVHKYGEFAIVKNVLQMSNTFVFPGAGVKWFLVAGEVGVIANWGEF